jgi:small redox-active disulfide protein 2
MKTIKVLGTGCPKCKQTISVIQQALEQNNMQADVQKIEDIEEIMQYNVLSTPAVVIDEEVKIKGKVPSVKEVLSLLEN